MRSIIVGTAGHVDHGKSALVRALTGIDTDRLEEEKRRGISIDLGFAPLTLGDGLQIGFVDVPGHERFVKNMLAGVGGTDLVLFVVAADESIKPQTREHFDICRLLGIGAGIVVITKADLVDSGQLDLVRLEVEEFVRGSFLEPAPVVAVSSTTGAGLDEVKQRLAEMAARAPERDTSRFFRLPIDRAFSLRGFGTVVTGTLVAGSVRREQEVEIYPGGRRLRVRSVQVHGSNVERAVAGQRTALNLASVDATDLARGMVLSEPGRLRAVREVDCRLELLPSAKPLKNRAPVHFHAGTAEIEAEARWLGSGYARLILREPCLLLPGDRFIIRSFSPVTTIGGGVVVDISGHRYRRKESAEARLAVLAEGTPPERAALLVREAPFGVGVAELVARMGIEVPTPQACIRLEGPPPWLADRGWCASAGDRLTDVLREFHQSNPLLPGMPKEDLRSRATAGAPAFLLDALLTRNPDVVSEGETVRLASHRIVLKHEEDRALTLIERAFAEAGLKAPAVAEVLNGSGVEAARARSILQILLKDKRLVRVSNDLVLHPSALERLRGLLAGRKGQHLSVGEFKDLADVSRKYAIPLLEYLDRERITRREGDRRLIL